MSNDDDHHQLQHRYCGENILLIFVEYMCVYLLQPPVTANYFNRPIKQYTFALISHERECDRKPRPLFAKS